MMNKIRVIVFGDLPISTKVCMYLLEHRNIDLVGVVIGNSNPKNNDPWMNVPTLEIFAKNNDIKIFDFDNIVNVFDEKSIDLGICARFSRIIKKKHLSLFKKMINFHGGLLPEFGGLYSTCHTILEKSPVGGGTIHYIDEGIDTGDIIKRCEFNVLDTDTSVSLFKKTQQVLLDGFIEVFQDLIDNNERYVSQNSLIEKGHVVRYFNKMSLVDKKEFQLSDPPELIDRLIRAFDFPGHEPAYFTIDGIKYFVNKSKKQL